MKFNQALFSHFEAAMAASDRSQDVFRITGKIDAYNGDLAAVLVASFYHVDNMRDERRFRTGDGGKRLFDE